MKTQLFGAVISTALDTKVDIIFGTTIFDTRQNAWCNTSNVSGACLLVGANDGDTLGSERRQFML